MSPRPYRLGKRQAATDETRARIIAAARELLVAKEGFAGFTIDAVARQAGVARMTVYYQYESKRGLLEAVLDDLAAEGQMQRMGSAFMQADPLATLSGIVTNFGRLFERGRLELRRLRGLAALDPEIDQGMRDRDALRRHVSREVVRRLSATFTLSTSMDQAIDLLYTLTSFETYDTLAGEARTLEAVAPEVERVIRAALGLPEKANGQEAP